MKIACGTCNYQGDSKADKDGVRIFCLIYPELAKKLLFVSQMERIFV